MAESRHGGFFGRTEDPRGPGGFFGHPEAVAEGWTRRKETAKNLGAATFFVGGAGAIGAGVLLGEALKLAMKVDFDAHGINAANEDATKMFSKGYDWAYGGKKAA